MKAYISYWNGGIYRIGEQNIGGSVGVEMSDAEFARLRQMQDSCDTFQKALSNLVKDSTKK